MAMEQSSQEAVQGEESVAMEQSSQELYKEKSQWPWNSLVKSCTRRRVSGHGTV